MSDDGKAICTMEKKWNDFMHNMRHNFKDEQQSKAFGNVMLDFMVNEKLWVNEPNAKYLRSLLEGIKMVMLSELPAGKQYGYWDIHVEQEKNYDVIVCRPMYKALAALVLRGNQDLEFIKADVVREGDEFEDFGLATPPKHKISVTGGGKIIGSYAVAGFKSGLYVREICTQDDLKTIRSKIKETRYHYIHEFEGEWSKIRAFKRLAKSLAQAMTPELRDRFAMIDQLDNQDYEVNK